MDLHGPPRPTWSWWTRPASSSAPASARSTAQRRAFDRGSLLGWFRSQVEQAYTLKPGRRTAERFLERRRDPLRRAGLRRRHVRSDLRAPRSAGAPAGLRPGRRRRVSRCRRRSRCRQSRSRPPRPGQRSAGTGAGLAAGVDHERVVAGVDRQLVHPRRAVRTRPRRRRRGPPAPHRRRPAGDRVGPAVALGRSDRRGPCPRPGPGWPGVRRRPRAQRTRRAPSRPVPRPRGRGAIARGVRPAVVRTADPQRPCGGRWSAAVALACRRAPVARADAVRFRLTGVFCSCRPTSSMATLSPAPARPSDASRPRRPSRGHPFGPEVGRALGRASAARRRLTRASALSKTSALSRVRWFLALALARDASVTTAPACRR